MTDSTNPFQKVLLISHDKHKHVYMLGFKTDIEHNLMTAQKTELEFIKNSISIAKAVLSRKT